MRSSNKTSVGETNRKKDWSTARVVGTERIPKQGIDSDSQPIKLPISLTDVWSCTGRVVVSMVQARDSALLPIDSRLTVSLSTLRFAVSLMQRVSRQPEGPQSSRRGNRVVTRILMIVV